MAEVVLQRVIGQIILESGESFQYCESFHPDHLESQKSVILLSSGKVNSFDDISGEQNVMIVLIQELTIRGYKVFQLQFEKRPASRNYATEKDIIKRLQVLIGFLKSEIFSAYIKSYAVLGISLGGLVVLKLLADPTYSLYFPEIAIVVSATVDAC